MDFDKSFEGIKALPAWIKIPGTAAATLLTIAVGMWVLPIPLLPIFHLSVPLTLGPVHWWHFGIAAGVIWLLTLSSVIILLFLGYKPRKDLNGRIHMRKRGR